jgi:hypothetical protein
VAEATFKRFDMELTKRVGQLVAQANHTAGEFEATPSDAHRAKSP